MFQGSCCHPISPSKKSTEVEGKLKIDENDQIFKITDKINIDLK